MTLSVHAAVDLGASGGRVVAGLVDAHGVTLDVVHRFTNAMTERNGSLRWNLTGLFEEVLHGIGALARRYPEVVSIGIDTWGLDYGLLDAEGRLLAEPVAYRDPRTGPAIERVHALVSPEELYRRSGVQFLPINTVYQLVAEQDGPLWEQAAHLALLPDLLAFWLTGELRSEVTNASTTGLLDVHERRWSEPVLARLGIPLSFLPPLEQPGSVRGAVLPALRARLGLSSTTVVTTVGSHDTASAVVGVPFDGRSGAYVASGTWSLVGLELERPIVTEAARSANFTNEAGVDGRTRFLRNVGGLWLLQECLRTWEGEGRPQDLTRLLRRAGALPASTVLIDVDDPAFIAPDDMPARVAEAVRVRAGRTPETPEAITRCIVDSLAAGYAATIERAAELTGRAIEVVHVVGGGSQNELLCRCTAEATGLPVVAGPVEATALGNVLVQARAHGAAPASLEGMRAVLASDPAIVVHRPSGTGAPA